jgi:hypothetical protein
MPKPRTTPPASAWVAIQDFTKNVVTLAGALIGLTVTFASQLLGKADIFTRSSLYFAWGAAVVAIACGVAAHGFVVGYLKSGNGAGKAVLFSNISFLALGAAALSFAVFGFFAVEHSSPTSAVAVAEIATASAPILAGDKNSKWFVKSLTYDSTKSTFDIIIVKEKSAETMNMTMTSTGAIINFQKP